MRQLNNSILKFKLYLLLGLFLTGPIVLAQTNSDSSNAAEIKESSTQNQIEEEHDTKNLEKLLIDYNKDAKKVIEDAEKIQTESSNEPTNKEMGIEQGDDVDETIKNAGGFFRQNKQQIDPKTLKKIKYSEAMRISLAPLQKMSEAELLNLLNENTKDSKAHEYIERFPKLALFTVRLIKDPEAIPSFAKIVDDQDRLIRFSGTMLCTIVFAFMLKRFLKKEGCTVTRNVSVWFLRFFVIYSLRIGILFYFYSAEITPTLKIVSKTFF